MTTEITKQPYSSAQVALIQRTVACGSTKDELALFLNVSKRCGLDPFSRQIYFIKRKVWNAEKKISESIGTIQTGIDGYRAIAEKSGNYAGSDDAIYDSEELDQPKKATVTVWKVVNGEKCSFTASARWNEYAAIHPKTKKIMGQWNKMPYLMLSKCAESLALRKAFPNDLSGLYTEDEMSRASAESEAIDITVKEKKETKKEEEMSKLLEEATPSEKEINTMTIEENEINMDPIEAEFKKQEEEAK